MPKVTQDWIDEIPIRAQGTLLTSMRSCDLAPKVPGQESNERALSAYLRFLVLNPADRREIGVVGGWFRATSPCGWKPSEFGHYPLHWYSHLMHCFQVCAVYHPEKMHKSSCRAIYEKLVHGLHLNPETDEQMIARLTEDRIANGTVACLDSKVPLLAIIWFVTAFDCWCCQYLTAELEQNPVAAAVIVASSVWTLVAMKIGGTFIATELLRHLHWGYAVTISLFQIGLAFYLIS